MPSARSSKQKNLGRVYPDGVLLTNVGAELSTEPDMMFASFATLEAERLRPVTRAGREDSVELEGTPDLVVEVVSDSSVRKDRVALREAYHGAGVPEYWIIDARGESVDFEILWLESDGYRASAEPASAQPSRVLARTFRIDRERDRLGQWRYQLRS